MDFLFFVWMIAITFAIGSEMYAAHRRHREVVETLKSIGTSVKSIEVYTDPRRAEKIRETGNQLREQFPEIATAIDDEYATTVYDSINPNRRDFVMAQWIRGGMSVEDAVTGHNILHEGNIDRLVVQSPQGIKLALEKLARDDIKERFNKISLAVSKAV